jgi:hypothetical protein
MYKIEHEAAKKSANSYDSINDSQSQFGELGDSKICSEFGSGEPEDFKSLKSRIRNPDYVCSSCGRSASDKSSLCWPEDL